ncbi:NADP-dependent oxidoreductase [Actinocorallia longicatena]|uniref:NADP-dependent oxidoreductase n=1 Tax=Actinocorallia longicatena TaxID=111803 RepID=A0ABP6QD61_9ACTN
MREIRLVTVPDGLPKPTDFEIAEAPVPEPGPGEVLVRTTAFHVFAALRTLLGGTVPGAPFPGIEPDGTLFGAAVGEVASGPGLAPGTPVLHMKGWREYAAVPVAELRVLDGTLPDPVHHLGYAPLAYAALTRDAGVRPGDTVFVTGGAGGVGSAAGQIARLLGAGRVVGSTGSAEKAARMTAELGYDAVVLRTSAGFDADLAEAALGGIDVLIDNVGGDQLRAALDLANPGARFVLVGALDGQLDPGGNGRTSPVTLDAYRIILTRATLRGVAGPPGPEAEARLGAWLRSGELVLPDVRFTGIEQAPRALHELLAGHHLGTVVVEL